jgi:hypothetical protein
MPVKEGLQEMFISFFFGNVFENKFKYGFCSISPWKCIGVCDVGFKFAGGGHRVVIEATENVHTALETDIFHLVTGAHVVMRGTGTAK